MVLVYIILCIVCVLLICLVLMQDSKSGLCGLTGGTTMSAFDANTDKALIKTTGVLGALFFSFVIIILLLNKNSNDAGESLMPGASKVEKKVVAPTVDLGLGKKVSVPAKPVQVESADDKKPAETKDSKEVKSVSETVPLSKPKEAPVAEPSVESKEKAVAPVEPDKK